MIYIEPTMIAMSSYTSEDLPEKMEMLLEQLSFDFDNDDWVDFLANKLGYKFVETREPVLNKNGNHKRTLFGNKKYKDYIEIVKK